MTTHRPREPADDRESARIVLGTVALGDDRETARILDRFYEAGGRALDLANDYGDGRASRSVGRWLAGAGSGETVLYAKGCHPPRCRPELVAAEVQRSLEVLGVRRIDVFLLHRDDPRYGVQEWADALGSEVSAGRIGAFGVSNWTVGRARALARVVARRGAGGFAAFSNHFSLADMVTAPWPGCLAMTRAEIDEVGALGLLELAWSSLAIGYFAGRKSPGWSSPENGARRERARILAQRCGVSPATVALAYVLHQPRHVLPVVGTRSQEHLDEAFAAARLALTPEELGWLRSGNGEGGVAG